MISCLTMKARSFFYTLFIYILGCGIGILLEFTYFRTSIHLELAKRNESKGIDSDPTVEDVKKIRILCFLNTYPASHGKRAVHVMETWGRHCDKILFASTLTDLNIGAIGFNLSNNHNTMWGKEKMMLKYVHDNFFNDYDWFYKGDDDSFVIVENLRFLLAEYSPEDPIYLGHKFNTSVHKRGYYSGGSGYVMSHETVRVFVEKVLTNREFYRKDDSDPNECHIETDDKTEDWHISNCLDYYNVYAGDSRDLIRRDRFLPFTPEQHLFGNPSQKYWYWERKYYFNDEGLDCCSNYSVAFHYISGQYQYAMYYLVYRLQPFGIRRRYPPPPKKKNFADVAQILDEETVNKSLRGY